jgi:hypothetical protein
MRAELFPYVQTDRAHSVMSMEYATCISSWFVWTAFAIQMIAAGGSWHTADALAELVRYTIGKKSERWRLQLYQRPPRVEGLAAGAAGALPRCSGAS